MRTLALNLWNILMRRLRLVNYGTKFVETKPALTEIPNKTVVIVGGKGWAKWAFMKCPCGCNEILTLSLMKTYSPNWRIEFDKLKRITFSPSLWKSDGCGSHFFIRKGKIKWV